MPSPSPRGSSPRPRSATGSGRRTYVAGLVLFSVASAACALAPDLSILIGFRAVQGLGAAIVMPLGLTLLTSSFPADRRGAVVGIWGGVAGLGVASGPLVGGVVTEGLDWHWIFWVNVPLGIAAVVAVLRVLPETYGPPSRLDPIGIVTASGAMGSLVWGVLRAPAAGWRATEVLVALALGSSSWSASSPGSPSRRRRWCRCRCSVRECSRPRPSPSS